MPLMKERTRLLREVGEGLQQYDGEAANLVKSAGKSATVLISKVLDLFPGFRDQTKYKEEEVRVLELRARGMRSIAGVLLQEGSDLRRGRVGVKGRASFASS